MPLRSEFLPFPFGGSVGSAFGAFLATNRFQVIFLRQGKLGNALIGWHFAAPARAGAQHSQSPVTAMDGAAMTQSTM
jgi:hypothetical protein